MTTSIEDAAARLGVKPGELKAVKDTRDGCVVTDSSDHQLLLTEGAVYWYGRYAVGVLPKDGGPPNAGLPVFWPGEGPAEDEPQPEPEPKKAAAAKK